MPRHPDHPLSEATAAWLDAMSPAERFTAMLAMNLTFPWLAYEPGWKTRLDELRREIGDAEVLTELTAKAARAVMSAAEEMGGADVLPSASKRRR